MKIDSKKIQSFFLYGIFVFYIILLLAITIFKYVSPLDLFDKGRVLSRSINLVPFDTIKNYLTGRAGVSQTIVWNNVWGNICLFIPLGIYLQLFKGNKNSLFHILMVLGISLMIEAVQYIFGIGATDIDDVILNCLGGIVGILLYKGLCITISDSYKIRTIVTLSSSIVGIPIIVLVILLVLFN